MGRGRVACGGLDVQPAAGRARALGSVWGDGRGGEEGVRCRPVLPVSPHSGLGP